MSEVKHTPGPWEAVITADYAEIRQSGNPSVPKIAIVGKMEDSRLIASAPKLLEALIYARRFLRGIDHDVDYVDGIIAEAEGRT